MTVAGNAEISESIASWIERTTNATLVSAERLPGGLSRRAYHIVLRLNLQGDTEDLVLLLQEDSQTGSGNAQDARILSLLAGTSIKVPLVRAFDEKSSALLVEKLPGTSDFNIITNEESRYIVTEELMQNLGLLHNLDIVVFSEQGIALPESINQCARQLLEPTIAIYRSNKDLCDPLFEVAISWLLNHLPEGAGRISLVHGDIGPGNFLFDGESMSGIVDWETSHLGDPMEDLARICIRSMSVPMGSVQKLISVYSRYSQIRIDRERLIFYILLTLVRSSLLIRQSLGAANPSVDAPQKYMYEALLMRAASDILLAEHKLAQHGTPPLSPSDVDTPNWVFDSLLQEIEEGIDPIVTDRWAVERVTWIKRMVRFIADRESFATAYACEESNDIEELVGRSFLTTDEGQVYLNSYAKHIYDQRPDQMVRYISRRMARVCQLRRSLMGQLFDRRIDSLDFL